MARYNTVSGFGGRGRGGGAPIHEQHSPRTYAKFANMAGVVRTPALAIPLTPLQTVEGRYREGEGRPVFTSTHLYNFIINVIASLFCVTVSFNITLHLHLNSADIATLCHT